MAAITGAILLLARLRDKIVGSDVPARLLVNPGPVRLERRREFVRSTAGQNERVAFACAQRDTAGFGHADDPRVDRFDGFRGAEGSDSAPKK